MLAPCNEGIVIKPDGTSVFQEMNIEWPSFSITNVEFWEHEYNRHGYCYSVHTKTTNDPTIYFQTTLDLFNSKSYADIFNKIAKTKNYRWDYDDLHKQIYDLIGPGFQLECLMNGDNQLLDEIHVYYDIDFNIIPNPVLIGKSCSKSMDISIFPFDYDRRNYK